MAKTKNPLGHTDEELSQARLDEVNVDDIIDWSKANEARK